MAAGWPVWSCQTWIVLSAWPLSNRRPERLNTIADGLGGAVVLARKPPDGNSNTDRAPVSSATATSLPSLRQAIERIGDLQRAAKQHLQGLGFANVSYMIGDGSLGWPECAPFDAIMVTAGAPEIPDPLIKQLADKGRLVIPVGGKSYQVLNFIRKHKNRIFREEFFECTFVPLVGRESWEDGA